MFWFPLRDRTVYLKVILLDHRELDRDLQASEKGKVLLDSVLDELRLVEREYFGLRYEDSDFQVHWLDTTRSLRKQLKKCSEPYVFYFCVKYYALEPERLLEERTRYQFFLQLKRDILHQNLSAPDAELAELGAFALQSEIGSYDPARHEPGYASEFTRSNFAPDESGRLVKAIETKHQTLRGLSQADAECRFLHRARRLDLYGVDMHPVQSEASGVSGSFLGLSPVGVMLIQNDLIMGAYAWPIITKIDKDTQWPFSSFPLSTSRSASVMIHVRGRDGVNYSYGFRLSTKEACRHLWKTTRDHCEYHRQLRGERVRPSSISSRISRLSSRFRSSSRAESDRTTSGETSVGRGSQRFSDESSRHTANKSVRQRLQSASVIHEDETRSMISRPPAVELDAAGRRRLPSDMLIDAGLDEVRELPVIMGRGGGRNGASSSRRSVSPMSMQSSFSTCPVANRRMPQYPPPAMIVEQDNDNDSVFSDSSRMSHGTAGYDTLAKKRKRSTLGENHSSGASEEADHPCGSNSVGNAAQRTQALRASLGPQRRRGKMPARHQTHDGLAIQQVLAQMSQNQQYATVGREQSLPDRLAAMMQPARSMQSVSMGRPRPPGLSLSVNPNLGKSMGQLSYAAAPPSPSIKDVQVAMDGLPLFSLTPADPLYLNSNLLNPPITPSAKLKGFEKFNFNASPASSASPPRNVTAMAVSASWTAGDQSVEFSRQRATPPPPSATKSRSFDFQFDSPPQSASLRPLPPDQEAAPVRHLHVRSISSSGGTNVPGRRLPARSRLRSDSCFQSGSREQAYEEIGRSTPKNGDMSQSRENSPLLSPYPIIPPPTPFTEEAIASPPAVPARNLITSKSTAKRLGVGGAPPARNDSFSAALKSTDIEMQSLRSDTTVPVERSLPVAGDNNPSHQFPSSSPDHSIKTRVVEVDVHVSNEKLEREVDLYDSLPSGKPKLANGRVKAPSVNGQPLQPSTASNQMYFEMNGRDSGREGLLPQTSAKSGYPVKPIPVHPFHPQHSMLMQCVPSPISHPLAVVHSKRRETRSEWLSPTGSAGTSSSTSSASPTDENDPSFGSSRDGQGSSKKLQAIYSYDERYETFTDI